MNNTALQIYALFILLILSVGCKDDWKTLTCVAERMNLFIGKTISSQLRD